MLVRVAMPCARAPGLLGVGQAVMDHVADELVDHDVVRGSALVASGHQTQETQERELVAERRHRQVQGSREVADGHLGMCERVHDPDPRGIRERLEYVASVLNHLIAGHALSCAPDLTGISRRREGGLGWCHAGRR